MSDMTNETKSSNLKKRNRAVLLVLLAIIALIFAITIVKIKVVGQLAVATPPTPYGTESGVSSEPVSGNAPADKPAAPKDETSGNQQ